VRFAAHAIGKHKKILRRDDAKAVFVVGANASYVAHAAAGNLHKGS
jgi:hypothetical protein